jgi:hypothetical protein
MLVHHDDIWRGGLLPKREVPLSEKTADARSSDGAVDEDNPIQMNSNQRHYLPHGGRRMSSW